MFLSRYISLTALAAVCAGPVAAAGIERSVLSPRILFEDGRYAEFSLGFLAPELEDPTSPSNGNLFNTAFGGGAAFKDDITGELSYAIAIGTPWGVDTEYPDDGFYAGVTGRLTGIDLSAILAYDVTPEFKLYGGLRGQMLEASAEVPFVAGYEIEADRDFGFGYLAGAAYQRPDIALRVSLTYFSAISHTLDTTETSLAPLPTDTETEIETPQSVTLEFQTGIMEDTLLFGSVRWVDWSEFIIDPPSYPPTDPFVDYEEDWWTYTLGVGRRFNDTWSGSLSVTYEPATDTTLTTLGPVDGRTAVTAGVVYNRDNMKITGGLTYTWLGETSTVLDDFEDGTAISGGLRIGFAL